MSSATILMNKGTKEAEKIRYELRKSQVINIKNSIYDVSDDYTFSINEKIEKINSNLQLAIKGITTEDLRNTIRSKKEKTGISDNYLYNYDNELDNEITDCQTKINNLDMEILVLNRQYSETLEREREEARKLLENAKDVVV